MGLWKLGGRKLQAETGEVYEEDNRDFLPWWKFLRCFMTATSTTQKKTPSIRAEAGDTRWIKEEKKEEVDCRCK